MTRDRARTRSKGSGKARSRLALCHALLRLPRSELEAQRHRTTHLDCLMRHVQERAHKRPIRAECPSHATAGCNHVAGVCGHSAVGDPRAPRTHARCSGLPLGANRRRVRGAYLEQGPGSWPMLFVVCRAAGGDPGGTQGTSQVSCALPGPTVVGCGARSLCNSLALDYVARVVPRCRPETPRHDSHKPGVCHRCGGQPP